jgi:4-hydroxy-tetrahydrodipicolinate synthase
MKGIHTAIVTPFDSKGGVDVSALERLIERQIAGGVQGIVACGTTGETPTLTGDEWALVVSTTMRAVAGRVMVTAGVGTNATASTVDNIRKAKALGVDAGLLVTPYYNKPNPAGIKAHVETACLEGLPLVLYHVPGRTGQRLPAAQLADLTNVSGILALKEATGDVGFGAAVISQTSKPVLSGDDFSYLGLVAVGGAGCISVVSNVDPARTVQVFDAYKTGDVETAQRVMMEILPLVTWLFSDSNPVPCKAALAELGLCGPAPRAPLAPFSGESPALMLQALGL